MDDKNAKFALARRRKVRAALVASIRSASTRLNLDQEPKIVVKKLLSELAEIVEADDDDFYAGEVKDEGVAGNPP
jgi:hypothetical protein